MICGVFSTTGMTQAEAQQRAQDYSDVVPAPLSVTTTRAADGTFTVTATWPPCGANTTHAVDAAAASAAAVAAPAGSAAILNGFDANRDCGKFVTKISAAGVRFVVRYYSHSAGKNLSFSEAKALSAAGVDLVSVWESAGDHAGFFTRNQGVDDATTAFNLAQGIGQPSGSPIYFAVDYDASQTELDAGILPYFRGVADGFAAMDHGAGVYTAGVYGSGLVCSVLSGAKLVTHTWLSMSSGFRGSKTYQDWNIKQHLPGDPFGLGFEVDPDEAKPGYGGWKV